MTKWYWWHIAKVNDSTVTLSMTYIISRAGRSASIHAHIYESITLHMYKYMHYFVSVVYGLFSTVSCRIESVVRVRLGESVDLSCRVNNPEDNISVSIVCCFIPAYMPIFSVTLIAEYYRIQLLYPHLYAHLFGFSNCRILPNTTDLIPTYTPILLVTLIAEYYRMQNLVSEYKFKLTEYKHIQACLHITMRVYSLVVYFVH